MTACPCLRNSLGCIATNIEFPPAHDGLIRQPYIFADASLDISSLADDTGIKFFYPFTTTLIELKLNREPLPLTGKNEVCWF